MAEAKTSSPTHLHIALFPFMSKGHTIPLLHLTKLIHKHRPHATFTIFTTPANKSFISSFLYCMPPFIVAIISLPFLAANDDVPPGVESSDQLPSMSLFYIFASAVDVLQPHFETALENLQKSNNPISFLISDGFLHWTQQSASKFNIPRLSFYGMSCYASAIMYAVLRDKPFSRVNSHCELIQLQDFAGVKITKNDIPSPWNESGEIKGQEHDFMIKCGISTSMSYVLLVNGFYELEPEFVDYCNAKIKRKHLCVGPLCLVEKPTLERSEKREWMEWLDKKWAEGKRILYVAFGSQAEMSNEQLKEIVIGPEISRAHFLWALRIKPNQEKVLKGFEERVKDRGLVVKGWVDQRVILEHESVQGFLSHCGWNSVIESVCASVPILAWPLTADQPLNARMVVEEIKVGLRVKSCDGLVKGFVKGEGLSEVVRELMEGQMGKVVREKVKVVCAAAKMAVKEGGSSWFNLEVLLNELEAMQNSRDKNRHVEHETKVM